MALHGLGGGEKNGPSRVNVDFGACDDEKDEEENDENDTGSCDETDDKNGRW